ALNQDDIADFKVLSYTEHALEQGAEAQAIAYIQIQTASGAPFFGAATDTNIELAAVKAVVSALNRSQK
ncbi:MAG TPA: alpha-isopropylmalate synthase regulatory domain-containing protein, partial [Ktedonobacteraceae bacterium]